MKYVKTFLILAALLTLQLTLLGGLYADDFTPMEMQQAQPAPQPEVFPNEVNETAEQAVPTSPTEAGPLAPATAENDPLTETSVRPPTRRVPVYEDEMLTPVPIPNYVNIVTDLKNQIAFLDEYIQKVSDGLEAARQQSIDAASEKYRAEDAMRSAQVLRDVAYDKFTSSLNKYLDVVDEFYHGRVSEEYVRPFREIFETDRAAYLSASSELESKKQGWEGAKAASEEASSKCSSIHMALWDLTFQKMGLEIILKNHLESRRKPAEV